MRPNIICHMIASVDGRIDCHMVDHISGDEYYEAMDSFGYDCTIEGRETAERYYATGRFTPKVYTPVGEDCVCHAESGDSPLRVFFDTDGVLTYPDFDKRDGEQYLVVTSRKASAEYLEYLHDKGIAYIVCGEEKINLLKAVETLGTEFGVETAVVVGGGHINGAFLEANLIDEVSIQIAAGIDGRAGQTAVFDGIKTMDKVPTHLKLESVKQQGDTVWIRYTVNQ